MILLFAWKAISYITLYIDNSYEYAYKFMDYSNVWCLKIAQKKMQIKDGNLFIWLIYILIIIYTYFAIWFYIKDVINRKIIAFILK